MKRYGWSKTILVLSVGCTLLGCLCSSLKRQAQPVIAGEREEVAHLDPLLQMEARYFPQFCEVNGSNPIVC